nr:porin family protein [uncultured Allomuricauda sp.]
MIRILSTLVLFLISVSVCSQNFEIGGRTGANITKLNYASSNTTSLVRPIIAMNAEYHLSPRWSLDGTLGFAGKGGGDFEEGDKLYTGIDDFKTTLDYATITILIRYYLKKESNLKPFLTFGPGISYIISAKQLEFDIINDLRSRFEISSIFGIGLNQEFNNNFSIELLGGVDRGWSKIIRAQNESLFNLSFWIAIGIKKRL